MSKRDRRGKSASRRAQGPTRQRATGRRDRQPEPAAGPAEEPQLVGQVADALEAGPLALLGLASSLLAALDPPRSHPFEQAPEMPSRDELLDSFFGIELLETSALLAAIAALSGDDVLRRRVHRELDERAHALPRWLADLRRARPAARTVQVSHVLRDGDNIITAVRLPDGYELSAVVYIDHNMGTVVKDAFVVDESLPAVLDRMLAAIDDPDTSVGELDPADARARITEAIELGAITFPPFESDSWPACRPLVQWMVGMLPADGTGYQRPEWSEAALAELTEQFFGSGFGAGLDDAEHRGLLESLLWFGTDYGPGDPLRWSPTAVEILLVDWIPRKIVADAEYLSQAPALLRAFLRFSHDQRSIRAELTEQTLAAVDEHEPDYQSAIRSERPQGPAALLAALGLDAEDGDLFGDPFGEDEDLYNISEIVLDSLRRAVGGQQALDDLGVEPLPDEPFCWDGIPEDVHERVGEVLELAERCAEELFDIEVRTACRRLLSAAAAGDPAIFRRRARAQTPAAAACWIVGKANDCFDSGLRVKDLTAHFGLAQSSVSQPAEPLLRALGLAPHEQYGGVQLGSPGYLTAARREVIAELRDRYRAPAEPGDSR